MGSENNLYLLTNETVNGYDTYDSCIVCAETEDEAKLITPDGDTYSWGNVWCNTPDEVICICIGKADSSVELGSVVIASFNAG